MRSGLRMAPALPHRVSSRFDTWELHMAFSAPDEHVNLAIIEHRARSVAHLFVDRVAATPAAEAFRFPRGAAWESVTWAQADERVRRQAAGLVALGVESEQRVAIISNTRYEWV